MRIPLTLCGFRLQLRIPQQFNITIHMSYYSFVDSINCSGFRKTAADPANLFVFGAILSGAMFSVFVCGLQNSKEDHGKVAMLRISQQI